MLGVAEQSDSEGHADSARAQLMVENSAPETVVGNQKIKIKSYGERQQAFI